MCYVFSFERILMALNRRTRDQLLACCGEIHDDDGVDPRKFFNAGRIHKKENRKARQLCHQVAVTLDQVLAGELGDEVLRGFRVAAVVPAPDASRLLVMLHADDTAADFDRDLVEQRLAACHGRLRCEVSAAITRRKTPVLAFSVVAPYLPDGHDGIQVNRPAAYKDIRAVMRAQSMLAKTVRELKPLISYKGV
jgi:ribosome-binding factor A